MPDLILAIDQGTTSSRAILFDRKLKPLGVGQKEFHQFYPKSGWVEHDPEEIWSSVLAVSRAALRKAKARAQSVRAIGITNQRETVVIWSRKTGKPIHKAIVWQDRRTAALCAELKQEGYERQFTEKTGLLLDPYFSGTKIRWLLDHVKGAREKAERGELAFGTIDTFLVWRLTGGKVHATDATNASRTLLYNIHTGEWDDALLRILNVPRSLLPEVKDCAADFGVTEPGFFGAAIPIRGVAGDQQAATVGQACFEPGMMKSTYGTGCFALLNTGEKAVASENRLLTTVAYQLDGKRTYALEGAIFIAGAAVQWLRDGLKLVKTAKETGALARAADPNQHVYLVPAFVGLGAPYWNADARGAIFGLTRATTEKELAQAALEAVCFQTRDLLEAMQRDMGGKPRTILRVDGGMTASDWTMQRLSDMLDAPVDRPAVLETTAVGAAYLAGLGAGLLPRPSQFARSWKRDARFTPKMKADLREMKYQGWKEAVRKLLA
ncbi:glycerol kinase GlpK [Aestuariivirga sp.]|uniref:glycerol kinase GlpK n=1 Tax=Aestuariivirga sp. TaxID=2650926 RepID=UPI003918A1B0